MTTQQEAEPGICTVSECGNLPFSRGWCGKHYQRWYKYGDPTKTIRPVKEVDREPVLCAHPGCGPHYKVVKGYCQMHYGQMQREGATYDPRLKKMADDRERFEARVVRGENEDDCWQWIGAIRGPRPGATKYAVFNYQGKRQFAHRVSYMWHHGIELTSAEPVHHTCANPTCTNPRHLQVVTPQENTAESLERKFYRQTIEELENRIKELEALIERKETQPAN